MIKQKITPFLWFDNVADEAMKYYTSIFKDSEIISSNPMGGMFRLNGLNFHALNGGPMYKFTPAISFYVDCEDQEEVDYFWDKFSEEGNPNKCGWITDKYGISWQIIPKVFGKLTSSEDPEVRNRVFQAMLKMEKMIVKDLIEAAENK